VLDIFEPLTDDSFSLSSTNLLFVCDSIIDEVKRFNFFQLHGFTCGIDDLLLLQKADKLRSDILSGSEKCSEEVHLKFTGAGEDLKGLWKLECYSRK
jgi:hypothetical protein